MPVLLLSSYCLFLLLPFSPVLLLPFIAFIGPFIVEEQQVFLAQAEDAHWFLKSAVRLLAAMGDHEGTTRACALVSSSAGRNEMYAAVLMGMAMHHAKLSEAPHWREIAGGL